MSEPTIAEQLVPFAASVGQRTRVQVGADLTLPDSPPAGEAVTILADSSTTIPLQVTWDAGMAPDLSNDRRLITFVWSGVDWVGTYGPAIPPPLSGLRDEIMSLAPVGYWPLDELSGTTFADVSGYGRDGTASVEATREEGFPRIAVQGEGISVPDADDFSLPGSDGITIFLLARTAVDQAGNRYWVSKRGGSTTAEWAFHTGPIGRVTLVAWGTGSAQPLRVLQAGSPYELAADTWYGMAAQFPMDGSQPRLYINSGDEWPVTPTSVSGTLDDLTNTTAPLWIGARADDSNSTSRALLGHVALFRKMLTGEEIGRLMSVARSEGLIP